MNLERTRGIGDRGLSYLTGLNTLILSRIRGITDESLAYLSNIHDLDLSRCPDFTDNGLAHLQSVNILDLSDCSQITDRGISMLSPNVKRLGLSGTSITDACLQHLVWLEVLNIRNCGISENGLKFLKFLNIRLVSDYFGLHW